MHSCLRGLAWLRHIVFHSAFTASNLVRYSLPATLVSLLTYRLGYSPRGAILPTCLRRDGGSPYVSARICDVSPQRNAPPSCYPSYAVDTGVDDSTCARLQRVSADDLLAVAGLLP